MSGTLFVRMLLAIWVVCVIVLSVGPYSAKDDPILRAIDPSAFMFHFGAYFVMALLLYYSYKREEVFFILLYGFLVLIFSILLEVIQIYLPYRNSSMFDITGNALGILCFIALWGLLNKRTRPHSS